MAKINMAKTQEEYRSRKHQSSYASRKRLEEQIGLDTYDADFEELNKLLDSRNKYYDGVYREDGNKSALDFKELRRVQELSSSLLSRTEALQKYAQIYSGGSSEDIDKATEWLRSQNDFWNSGQFDVWADYTEYERLSGNYDFDKAQSQLAQLQAEAAKYPKETVSVPEHKKNPKRSELEKQIAALKKEMATARVYASYKLDSLPDFDEIASKAIIMQAADGSYEDIRHAVIMGEADDWFYDYDENAEWGVDNWMKTDGLLYLTGPEKRRYNYYYRTQGKEVAGQYLDGLQDELYARMMSAYESFGEEHPVLGTLAGMGMRMFAAVESLFTEDDEIVHFDDMSNALKSGASANIENDVGKFFYNVGTSIGESFAASALGPAGGATVLGLSAYASTRNDMLRRGADPETATKAGLAAGIFEGLFEKFSLEQLKVMKTVPVNGFKDLVLNVAKSAGVNASEEMLTEVANILYDTFFNGEYSEWQMMLDQGMSEEEIKEVLLARILEATASGAVSGVGFGGIGSAASGISNARAASQIGKAIKGGETTFGSLSGITELGDKYGIKQTAKVKAKGTKASNRAVGDLYRRVSAAVAHENQGTTKAAIEKRLAELGTDKAKVGKLADAVLKKYMRQSLSFRESAMLDKSKAARQTLSEMLENSNSKWVNDLRATLMGEASRDISTISDKDIAAAAEQAAEIARSEGPEVQAANGESLGSLPKIASLGVNGVSLAAPSGEVALDEAAMPEDKALLYTLAGLLPSAEIANDFVQAWDGATDPSAYFNAYQMIYTYGRHHAGYTDAAIAEAGKKSGLSEAQISAAFKSGVQSLAEERRMERERLDGIIAKFRESGANRPEGKWDATGLRGVDLKKVAKENLGLQDVEQFVAFLRMTTKAFGWNVRVIADKSDKRSNGGYNPATNTLTFNIYAGTKAGTEIVRTAMPNTISHETVHWMKRNAPEQYQALEDMVLAALKNANDYDFGEAVLKEYGKYKEKHGQDIDDATAREEIVARACEDLFGRSEAIQQFLADFAEKNKEAATGFTAAVKKVLAKIKAFFENLMFGHSSRTLEAGIVRKCGADVVQGLQEQYEKTFFAALEGNAARNALGEFEQGGVRFSIMENPIQTGERFVAIEKESIDKLNQYAGDSLAAKVRNYLKQFRGTVLPLGSTDKAYMRREAEGEYTNSAKALDGDVYLDKLNAASEFANLLSCAKHVRHEADNGRHPDAVRGWNYYELKYVVPLDDGTLKVYKGEVQIKLIARGDCFYDITKIEDITNGTAGQALIKAAGSVYNVSTNSIPQNAEMSTPSAQENPGNSENGTTGLKSDPADDVDYAEYDKPITIRDVDILRSIGRKSVNEFSSDEIKKAQKWAYKFYKELGVKSPFFRAWFGDWRAHDHNRIGYVSVNAQSIGRDAIPRGDFYNEDTKWMIKSNADGIDETSSKEHKWSDNYHALSDIDKMLKSAVLLDSVVVTEPSKRLGKNAVFMHHLYCPVVTNGKKAIAKLYVAESIGSEHKFYLLRIEKTSADMGLVSQSRDSTPRSKATSADGTISIAEIFEFVKNHNMDFEANSEHPIAFSPKPVHEALIDKKTGLPTVFYHGTNAEFYVFRRGNKRTRGNLNFGDGYYFTSSRSMAENYADGENGRVMETYVAIRNPYTVYWSTFDQSDFDAIAKKLGDGTVVSNENVTQCLQRLGYDGVIERTNNGADNPIRTVVAFESAQIKSATDNIGTYDGGNDNILYSDPEDDIGEFAKEELAKIYANFAGDNPSTENLAQLRWQIENITKINEDSKRLNANVDHAEEAALIEAIVSKIKGDNKTNAVVQSDREILAGALMSVAQNEIERNALKVYQGYAKKLDAMNKRLGEVNAELRTMMFQKGTRDETYTKKLEDLKAEKNKLEKGIARWDSKLFSLEVTKSLQDLLDREKQRTAKLWIDAGRKAMNNYREKQLCRVYTQKIEEKAKNLRKMLLENSEKYHIPDAFKKPVAAFLSLLDFSSERALQGGELTKKDMELQAAFEEVVNLLKSLTDENSTEYVNGLDLPPDAVEEFVALSKEVAQMAIDGREGDTMVLRRMSSEQLKTLNTTLYAMTRAVRQANDLFANERFRHVSEIALDFIGNSEQYAVREKRSKISDFLSWENMVPYYAFRRLGAAGEALFKGFMQGQDKFAFLVKDIIDFTDKLYTKQEVKEWSRQVHTFDGTNGKVYITTAQIMSLYELWKDKDARQHILGGGGRIQDIDFGIKKKYTNDPNGTALGELVVDAMFAKLTPRQKAVADSLQKFMAEECAKWGNEVSYKRWGIRIFGLDYYFPIESDKNTVAADVEQRAKESGLFSLLHKSFTKKRVFNANNRIMIRSVFDVFASHTTDMAKYHAFALPLLDMQKFINFKEIVRPEGEGEVTTELPAEGEQKDTSFTTKEVRASMEKAFGTAAYKYIEQFLIDLNGNIGGRSAAEGILQKGITAHKIAAVGANLRVALLQPTAYMRLLNVMEPKYFFGGLGAAGHLKACIERMQKYSGIALWKSLGYRDTNIAAPIQTKIKHDETWRDKITEKSMFLSELGDKVTWGMIWHACELETRGKRADLNVGSEEYYRAVGERFTEVIYATQVVDSTLTKSQIMRKKDFFSTLFTSFMSEPTLSYNLLASNALSLMDAKRRGGKVALAAAKPLMRAIGTFAIGALLQAAVESMIDAARAGADDDEPYGERYWEEFLANTIQEIVPLNLIPVVKDIWSIALSTIKGDYMQSSRMDLEVYHRIARAVKATVKMFEDGEAGYAAIYKILTAVSSVTGLPISNLVRDVQAIWNAIIGDMFGGAKWKSN